MVERDDSDEAGRGRAAPCDGRCRPLADGVVIVTGATAKVGAETARHLGRSTNNRLLLCCHRDRESLESLASGIRGARGDRGEPIDTITADLADDAGLRAVVDAAVAPGGPVAGLVHFASAARLRALADLDRRTLRAAMEVDVEASALLMSRLLYRMADGAAVVLAGGSVVTRGGMPLQGAYGAAKMALFGLMRGVLAELTARGVRINLIELGIVGAGRDREVAEKAGPFMPMGRAGRPHELAALVRFLLSREASYVTGQRIAFAGGA